jgi:hypothetical protein
MSHNRLLWHCLAFTVLVTTLILVVVYPFLPGGYDSLAVALSTMAQVFGVLGLLLVPVGLVWLMYEVRKAARLKRGLPTKARGFAFALASVIVFALIVLAVALVGVATAGIALGMALVAVALYALNRLIPRLKQLKAAESMTFNMAPLYFLGVPVAVLLAQLVLAAPMTAASRDRAIAASGDLIRDLEDYHTENGRYPDSLLAVWPDYEPSVVGVERYEYEPKGDAYNLVFEQPRFLLDNIGAREFVVYNKLDENSMVSHASWILLLSPAELERRPGWYAVQEASNPNWRTFWFD